MSGRRRPAVRRRPARGRSKWDGWRELLQQQLQLQPRQLRGVLARPAGVPGSARIPPVLGRPAGRDHRRHQAPARPRAGRVHRLRALRQPLGGVARKRGLARRLLAPATAGADRRRDAGRRRVVAGSPLGRPQPAQTTRRSGEGGGARVAQRGQARRVREGAAAPCWHAAPLGGQPGTRGRGDRDRVRPRRAVLGKRGGLDHGAGPAAVGQGLPPGDPSDPRLPRGGDHHQYPRGQPLGDDDRPSRPEAGPSACSTRRDSPRACRARCGGLPCAGASDRRRR